MNGGTILMPDLAGRRARMHYVTALNELARLGVEMSRIELLAIGEHRNYRGEVHHQNPSPGEVLRADTPIRLHIGFPSAVDVLPHQFFVGFESRPDAGREWEERSRRLLAPFDAAVIRHDAWALYRILKVSFGYFDRAYVRQFLDVFGIQLPTDPLSDRELLTLAMVLPAVNDWGGNAEAVEAMLELFFGYPAVITESVPRRYEVPLRLRYHLATDGRLGEGTLLGGSFVESEAAFRVTISGIEPEDVAQFLPGRPTRRKVDWLLRLTTPNQLQYELRLVPRRQRLALGDRAESYLGYATYFRAEHSRTVAGSST